MPSTMVNPVVDRVNRAGNEYGGLIAIAGLVLGVLWFMRRRR